MSDKPHSHSRQAIPVAEWIVAAIGSAMIIATFGFLLYRGFSEDAPPAFSAEVRGIERNGSDYAVSILVHNRGGRPVSNLVVRGSRDHFNERELTIDYLPAQSSRKATFLFGEPIEADQFRCVFTSYTDP